MSKDKEKEFYKLLRGFYCHFCTGSDCLQNKLHIFVGTNKFQQTC